MSDVHLLEPVDGRSARRQRTRAAILDACREFMRAGRFRPGAVDVARMARCSTRTMFEHFGTVDRLYLEAIADIPTRELILGLVIGSLPTTPAVGASIVRAIVLGRSS